MRYGVGRMVGAVAVAAALTAAAGAARAETGVNAGYLQCSVGAGWSQFVTSTRKLDCTYSGVGGATQRYTGEVRMYGLDVLYVDQGVLAWAVLAHSSSPDPGELAGEYTGAAANVAVGLGVGANVLVGGFDKSITLQPVSFGGMVGGGLSVGFARLTLVAAR